MEKVKIFYISTLDKFCTDMTKVTGYYLPRTNVYFFVNRYTVQVTRYGTFDTYYYH